jgi:hypothetical protein
MNDISVRVASPCEENEIFDVLLKWHAEEGLASFDYDAAREMLVNLLTGSGVVGVIGDPGKIEASISLLPGRLWYSSESTLESLWNFVLPNFRKSANAKALALFAKRQAERLSLSLLLEIVATPESLPKLALYERIFGPRAGAAFHYRPDGQSAQVSSDSALRTAKESDLPDIIDICREAHRESGSFEAAEEFALPVIQDELAGSGVIGLIGRPGRLEGTISFHTARMWYSHDPLIEERWAYVRPQFRRSNNAKDLINFAKRQSELLNVPLRIGIISKKETEQKVNLYRRLLGEPAAAYFLYRPQ